MRKQQGNETLLDIASAFEQAWLQYRFLVWKLLPFGFMVSFPFFIFFYSMPGGIAFTVLFEGVAVLMLVSAFRYFRHHEYKDILSMLMQNFWFFVKNGFLLSLFLFPLLILGSAVFIFPAVLFFSFFMFSFFEVASNDKFAIDACMESYRMGRGYRIHLFLFSLVVFASLIIVHIFTDTSPFAFLVVNSFLIPYFVIVINELFEQIKKT
ncbi:MAG: hypothetical protein R6W70_01300 [bacterium]